MICESAKERLMKADIPKPDEPYKYNEYSKCLIVKNKFIRIGDRFWKFTGEPNCVKYVSDPIEYDSKTQDIPIHITSYISDLRESLVSDIFVLSQVGIGDDNYIYKILRLGNPYTLSEHQFMGEKHYDLKINLTDKYIEYSSVNDPRLGGIAIKKEITKDMFDREGILVDGFYKSESYIIAKGVVDVLGEDELRIDGKSYTIKKIGDRYNIELSKGFGSNMLSKPFAGYKNFKDCVEHNRDKKDPEAYCATIMRAVEDK